MHKTTFYIILCSILFELYDLFQGYIYKRKIRLQEFHTYADQYTIYLSAYCAHSWIQTRARAQTIETHFKKICEILIKAQLVRL